MDTITKNFSITANADLHTTNPQTEDVIITGYNSFLPPPVDANPLSRAPKPKIRHILPPPITVPKGPVSGQVPVPTSPISTASPQNMLLLEHHMHNPNAELDRMLNASPIVSASELPPVELPPPEPLPLSRSSSPRRSHNMRMKHTSLPSGLPSSFSSAQVQLREQLAWAHAQINNQAKQIQTLQTQNPTTTWRIATQPPLVQMEAPVTIFSQLPKLPQSNVLYRLPNQNDMRHMPSTIKIEPPCAPMPPRIVAVRPDTNLLPAQHQMGFRASRSSSSLYQMTNMSHPASTCPAQSPSIIGKSESTSSLGSLTGMTADLNVGSGFTDHSGTVRYIDLPYQQLQPSYSTGALGSLHHMATSQPTKRRRLRYGRSASMGSLRDMVKMAPGMPQQKMEPQTMMQMTPSVSCDSLSRMVSSGSSTESLPSLTGEANECRSRNSSVSPLMFNLTGLTMESPAADAVKQESTQPSSLPQDQGKPKCVSALEFRRRRKRKMPSSEVDHGATGTEGQNLMAVARIAEPRKSGDTVRNKTRSCMACVKDKKKCDGGRPCYRCIEKCRQCVEPSRTRKRKPYTHICMDCYNQRRPKFAFPSNSNLRRHQRESCMGNPNRATRRPGRGGLVIVKDANSDYMEGLWTV